MMLGCEDYKGKYERLEYRYEYLEQDYRSKLGEIERLKEANESLMGHLKTCSSVLADEGSFQACDSDPDCWSWEICIKLHDYSPRGRCINGVRK